MKKWTIVSLIVAVFAFALVGCGGNQEANNGGNAEASINGNKSDFIAEEVTADQATIDAATQEIKDKGKLVLATSADYPPYEWHLMKDGKDEIVGFDIEIAKALADSLGVELEIKDLDFDGIIPSITSGLADICIGGISASPRTLKRRQYDLSLLRK